MSEVFLAEDVATGQRVALKLFKPQFGARDDIGEARRRFVAEAMTLSRMSHPDIIGVVAAGEDAGRLWMALEYVPGHDLVRYVHRTRLLPEPVVVGIGSRLARALHHAHAHGIVHRDVKPANVRIDLATDIVKLGDFGVARWCDAGGTGTGLMLGTPAYMAPELLAGGDASPAADLHALGVVLFELLTGRRPYQGDSLGDLMRAVVQQPVPDIRTMRPGLPRKLAELLMVLMAKDSRDRPSSGAAVADALDALDVTGPAPGGSEAQSQGPSEQDDPPRAPP